jgi:hypothetical protein
VRQKQQQAMSGSARYVGACESRGEAQEGTSNWVDMGSCVGCGCVAGGVGCRCKLEIWSGEGSGVGAADAELDSEEHPDS